MHCTKCGREIKDTGVFCQKCMDVMQQHPVKPGTTIQLPQRTPNPGKKSAPRRRYLPPEEIVVRQRKTIRWLVTAMVCILLMCGLSIAFLLQTQPEEAPKVTIGQNYVTKNPTADD